MADNRNHFVWYELMTTDMGAAKAFYTNVVGWGAQNADMPELKYTLFMTGETHVGGLMDLTEDARKRGVPPMWLGYVAVEDVDAVTEKAKSLGGHVHVEPRDIPEVGRFSVVTDPQRAPFALFKSSKPDQEQPPAPGTPGRIGWHELMAADWEKAFDFYSALFGWKKSDAMDMGAMGTYQLFSVDGGMAIGGMFNKPAQVPYPFWLYYFNVGNIDEASERVKTGGGQILHGPMEVPGGDWIIQGQDPQGAMFALAGKRG